MVPPGNRKYFFSIAGKQYCAEDHDKIKLNHFKYKESDLNSARNPTKIK